MPQKIYNLRLHRWTVVTVGCGVMLVSGLMFFAGALLGHWWAERPETTVVTDDTGAHRGSEVEPGFGPADGPGVGAPDVGAQGVAPGGAPATQGRSAGTVGGSLAPPVSGPRVTGPAVSGPRLSGPRVSRSGVSGPRVSQPTVRGPTATGPRVGSPRRPTAADASRLAGSGGAGPGDMAAGAPAAGTPAAGTPAAGTPAEQSSQMAMLEGVEAATPVPELFAVQVGLYAETEEALAEIETLSARGYAPYLVVVRAEERRTVVRSVRLGPYPDRRTAQEVAANFRLDENRGAAVVREHDPPAMPGGP